MTSDEPFDLVPGDVVQLNPETVRNPLFGGAFMIVTEVKPWGAQGYCHAFGSDNVVKFSGLAYYRARWCDMEFIGRAEWVANESATDGEEGATSEAPH